MKYYDKEGNEISRDDWCQKMEDVDYKFVARTDVEDGEVSTVWLGMDHSFGEGPILIFETMTFGDISQIQRRYSTIEEAREGHDEVVATYTHLEETAAERAKRIG